MRTRIHNYKVLNEGGFLYMFQLCARDHVFIGQLSDICTSFCGVVFLRRKNQFPGRFLEDFSR